ncbi:diphosphomevalonate decarboxylase [Euwallacea similis]|uniref:diphosphomevalonate decarboxylase n=1 Tax=Euwallacea similis TaxID=1736056 RepID=UPI00344DAF9C
MKIVTCVAPVNIAVIKYWGKRDEDLILPINDSVSASLSTDVMCTKTTVMASPSFAGDTFWLNGKEQNFDNSRLKNCLKIVKQRCDPNLPHFNWKISICSENNFPTAAGLASSAAGYACLVYALAQLYEITGEISDIARQGSGSACRSMYGGWVVWYKGALPTGADSIARQIAPATHWPEMRAVILVVNDSRKKYSSTSGMKRTVETSALIKQRADVVVPLRVEAITAAILAKNFETFANLTMRDSNQLHAVCLDTFPPCVYMNDTSQAIVDLVHSFNEYKKANKVAYTFDAGPNACIYLLESVVQDFISLVNYVFPKSEATDDNEYYRGLAQPFDKPCDEGIIRALNLSPYGRGMLKYIIHTRVGDGPKVLTDPKEHLLQNNGVPKTTLS